jgi:hypothetical protein
MTLLERAEAMLKAHGITPDHAQDDLITYINCGVVSCRLLVCETKGMLRVYITFPIHVPDYQRLAVGETTCRINYALHAGAMELDMADGELRFRNILPALDSVPTDEQIDWVLFWSWGLVKRYARALLEVTMGTCEPEVAVAKVETPGLEMVTRGSLPN